MAKAINYGNYDMTSILVEPLLEIVLSILMGFVMGSIFSAAEKYFKSNSKRLSLSITFVILTVALSMMEFEVGGVKGRLLQPAGVHDAGHGILQRVRFLGGDHGEDRPHGRRLLYHPVLCAQRRGTGAERIQQHVGGHHRRGVYPCPALSASGWARASARSS